MDRGTDEDGNRRIRGEVGDRIWTPPAEGWVKINIDAAVFLNETIGVGAVIRDDHGRFVGARGQVHGSLEKRRLLA